jgi:hypothetical protein
VDAVPKSFFLMRRKSFATEVLAMVFAVLCRMSMRTLSKTQSFMELKKGGGKMRKLAALLGFLLVGCATQTQQVNLKHIEPQMPVKQEKEEESLYKRELMEKLMKMVREEPTPLALPPTVLRVFVLPYVDDQGRLITQHYMYIRVDEGKWLLGDYLLKKGQRTREFTPLKTEGQNEGK